ncbi:MAG: phosphotransferase [Candidatus Woesebacteria bacterium]|nr:phosphotransferase [Candidatus Woesebacteria bacterium]
MIEIVRNTVLGSTREKGLGASLDQKVSSFLAKNGVGLSSVEGFSRDVSAMTNNVFVAELVTVQGEKFKSIIKISETKREPREVTLSEEIGGWNPNKLENESKILALIQNEGIAAPYPILYGRPEGEVELFIETIVEGKKCVDLRVPNVSPQELSVLEFEKGKILASINSIPLLAGRFGTLEIEAKGFDTWSKYFLTKVTTTLSCLYGMYDKVNKLEHFSDLVDSEDEWKTFLQDVAKLYSSEAVLRLIDNDGKPTLSHGDFWDGNLIANKTNGKWNVSVIDFERGGIEGKSFDLSLWLAWKIGGMDASQDFLKGYTKAGGSISQDIDKYVAIYGLWQYMDFLIMDTIYGIDRTDESVREIKKLRGILQNI